MSRRILVVAGEASGDALAAGLIRAARSVDPSVRFHGMGGQAMREAGAEILVDAAEVAVVGLFEVLARLPRILAARGSLRRALGDLRPERVLLVDFPDFNLRFAAHAKRAGVPVYYFVSPQVWAWRRGRVATIASRVSRMMVLFPFEEEIYRAAGVPVVFTGHPLVDADPPALDPAAARARLGLGEEGPVLALLPGSRAGEVSRLLPPLLESAAILREARPGLRAVIPVASTVPAGLVEDLVRRSPLPQARPVHGLFYEVLDAADAAVVASGTATLQAALRGTPMVVVYRMHPVSGWIARRMVRVRDIALVNLVAGRRIVPELVQEACTPRAIAAEAGALLDDDAANSAMRASLGEVRARLGPPGAYERAARVLLGA